MANIDSVGLGPMMPEWASSIVVCHDRAKTTIWLELTNTDFILNGGQNSNFVTVYIGAVNKGGAWVPVDRGTVNRLRSVTREVGFAVSDNIGRFQKAIVDHWKGFSSQQAKNWAKGTTFGTSLTSASFAMKALKTGFDAVGEPMHAYQGFRVADFVVDDVIRYMEMRAAHVQAEISYQGFGDFHMFTPAAQYEPPGYKRDAPTADDTRLLDYIESNRPHSGRFAYADTGATYTDANALTKMNIPFERVVAYGFRGDKRGPKGIREAGGFLPNFTRPDHINRFLQNNRDLDLKSPARDPRWEQALNLEKFIKDQFFGGYVSATKSVAVARCFATGNAGTSQPGPGWIYACFVEGGLHLPMVGSHNWVLYNEQEISMVGMLDWDDVVACRHAEGNGDFDGPVYIKPDLLRADKDAAREIWELLSGRSQG